MCNKRTRGSHKRFIFFFFFFFLPQSGRFLFFLFLFFCFFFFFFLWLKESHVIFFLQWALLKFLKFAKQCPKWQKLSICWWNWNKKSSFLWPSNAKNRGFFGWERSKSTHLFKKCGSWVTTALKIDIFAALHPHYLHNGSAPPPRVWAYPYQRFFFPCFQFSVAARWKHNVVKMKTKNKEKKKKKNSEI